VKENIFYRVPYMDNFAQKSETMENFVP